MKTTTVASALLAAMAAAQPHAHGHGHHHAKRELVTETAWVTEVEYVTQLVDSTTTVWITPGQEAAPTTTSAPDAQFHEDPTTSSTSTSTSTTSTTSSAPPPPPPKVEPKPTTKKQPPPPPPAPKPTTTSKAAPPPPVETSAEPAATQPSSGGGGGTSGSAGDYDGEITYYTVGVGSCGETQTGMDNSEGIVALSTLLMTPLDPNGNPNNNPMCGQMITIHSNGKTVKGRVSDKCGACKINDIDVSEKIYKELWGGLGTGRMPVTWSFDDYTP